MRRFWWKFRDFWCWPFGHMLYFPIGGRWECACSVMLIGGAGNPLRFQWESFRNYWRRGRRPSRECPRWDEHLERGPSHNWCPDCHGRLWVRA